MKTLLVLQGKGGVGKSSSIRNLAPLAAASGLTVGTLDTDTQGTLSDWHKARVRHPVPVIAGFHVNLSEAVQAIQSAEGADLLIIDTPPWIDRDPAAVRMLIEASQLVLMPSQPLPDDVRTADRLMRTVVELGTPGLFVLNRAKPRVRETTEARLKLSAVADVAGATIPDSIDIVRAMANGLGISETQGRGSEEYASLWAEIKRRMSL